MATLLNGIDKIGLLLSGTLLLSQLGCGSSSGSIEEILSKDDPLSKFYLSTAHLYSSHGWSLDSDYIVNHMLDDGHSKEHIAAARRLLKDSSFRGSKATSIELLKSSAEAGLPAAQTVLGCWYLWGTHLDKDYEQAHRWFDAAIKQGSEQAKLWKLSTYIDGKGVAEDRSYAFDQYLLLADEGNTRAMVMIANCYSSGEGVEQDASKAFEWNNKAAKLGSTIGMQNIGLRYLHGNGVKTDRTKAREWLQKAYEGDNLSAAVALGAIYRNGWDIQTDYKKAHEIFSAGAKNPVEESAGWALNHLGLLYDEGLGVSEDKRAALAYYRRSHEKGNEHGAYNAGLSYEFGKAGITDRDKAAHLYAVAAARGHSEAIGRLRGLGGSEIGAGYRTVYNEVQCSYCSGRGSLKTGSAALKTQNACHMCNGRGKRMELQLISR